ncbi:hypothetical protein EDD36DRAFT_423227 [Exophiala viscosa]|uniref:Alpha-L-rhamnosidase C-terminal domain-containing protein n=1 Tax=Exophiala viscosa TaxID=2486360 RepID=A0AAN6DPI3_9EURO|nr:hypothetical protein EDD36DRAFT_423227 [Exophiala viscosa]
MRRTIDTQGLPKCSYSQSFYVLRAAAKAGIYEAYFDRLIAPWREMIANNLTTWAEDDIMFRSDCHGWSSSPVYEIVHEIFGLSLAENGYRKVRIAPRFALQEEASGTFVIGKDDQGDITVNIEWNREDKRLVLSASRNIEATVVSKDGITDIVTLGSKPLVKSL